MYKVVAGVGVANQVNYNNYENWAGGPRTARQDVGLSSAGVSLKWPRLFRRALVYRTL